MTRFHPVVSEFPSSRFFTVRNKHVENEMLKVKNNTLPNTCDLSARFLMNIRVCDDSVTSEQHKLLAVGSDI